MVLFMIPIICGIERVGNQPLEHNMTITEFYIERRLEMAIRHLEEDMIKGIITQKAYNDALDRLDYWASQQYQHLGEQA